MLKLKQIALVLALASGAAHAADDALVKKGEYLAVASDCTACHTAEHGKPFAGGKAIESPVGEIIATNITPSKIAGIGQYSEQQF
ncbi:cytochrome C, partial [Pantoea rodasii]